MAKQTFNGDQINKMLNMIERGNSVEEIAETLGRTPEAVKSKIYFMRKKLSHFELSNKRADGPKVKPPAIRRHTPPTAPVRIKRKSFWQWVGLSNEG